MKYLKYTATGLALLAILVTATHFYRESIARKLANSVLAEFGMTATELTIQTLGTNKLELSHLVLEQDDGSRYEVSALSLPLVFSATAEKNISIGQLHITPATAASAPILLTDILQTILELPKNLPNTEVTISRILLPDIAPVENLLWQCTGQQQHLAFQIDAVTVTLDIDRLDDGGHQVGVNIALDGVPDALSLTVNVLSTASGFTINGLSNINLPAWFPILRSSGLLPAGLTSLGGEVGVQLMIVLENKEESATVASAELLFDGELSANYAPAGTSDVKLHATLPEPYRLRVEYPSLQWSINVQSLDLLAETTAFADIPITFTNLECHTDIQCTMQVSLESGPLDLGGMTIDNAKLSASLAIASDAITRVDVSPDSILTLTGIKAQGVAVASISATQFANAELTLDDRGLRFATGFSIQPASATVVHGGGVLLPGIDGKLSLRNNKLESSIVLSSNDDTVSAKIDASYDLSTAKASLSARDATLRFDSRNLSEQLSSWPYAWDLAAGTLTAGFDLTWQSNGDDFEFSGTANLHANDLAGNYGDIVFTGLNNSLSAVLDSASRVTILPASIEVALLDVGIPLEQIAANFELNIPEQSIQVQSLSMSAMGGTIAANPFRFAINEDTNSLVLQANSIQLQFMVDLAEFDDIQLTGSISGEIPVTMSSATLTIEHGRLASDPPGGVIRYLPGIDTESEEVSDSPLNLVSRALANFQFESLTADVDYTENGDLILQMRLAGMNPDMDDQQPVILNLGIENNIPQLLRSLRAVRSVEDVLERRSN